MGLAACYAFRLWLRKPGWCQTIIAGAVLGLAELTKFTLIVFYPLWLVMWIVYRLPERRELNRLARSWEV
jgi:4-amino-4-deoxy-L-arabinose transferase-like glycosyltransferase